MKLFSFIITLALLNSCYNNKKINKPIPSPQTPDSLYKNLSMKSKIDYQGHRGCRGLMPENTIPGMIKALELGVTTLEMDISISKDKKVFLSHEPFFNHEITTKPDGSFITEKEERSYNTYKMDYDSIIKYDVGLKPHPRFPKQEKLKAVKPLLSDLFKTVKERQMNMRRPFPLYNIETKTLPIGDNMYHPAPAEFVELLMKVIMEEGMEDYVTIQSFDFRTLQYLHQHYPQIKTAMLIEDFNKAPLEDQLKKLGFTASIYSPHYSLVTAQLVQQCHAIKMKLIPWTVNDKKEIERLIALGIDGIISDYPDLFFAP